MEGDSGAERHAYRDDMGDSYGAGYTTRSSDEGYGEIYGEAVKAVMDKKSDKAQNAQEMQSGMTANRDQSADVGVHPEYDGTQGAPVKEKEDARHATSATAFEDDSVAKSRAAELGGRGGVST